MAKTRAATRERGRWKLGTEITIDLRGGEPVPKGSMKAFNLPGKKFPIITDSKTPELRAYERDIRNLASVEMDRYGHPCATEQPFEVQLVYYLARPNGDYFANGDIKPGARAQPWVKPDLDKLERATLDALTGMVWDDDSRVVRVVKEKRYRTRERDIGLWIKVIVLPATMYELAESLQPSLPTLVG